MLMEELTRKSYKMNRFRKTEFIQFSYMHESAFIERENI